MCSIGLTFWAGCKKEDAEAFNAAALVTPFKGKQMTLGAAKAHYQKSQQALGKNYRTANDGDVDWENAVLDTAANGQVEVIAPVKGYAYSGTDGRKWAINTKFEYDENGNPQGDYAIVTHDIGNTADDWTGFSGHVWYFGMDKVFKEGYKYTNGIGRSVNLYFDDSLANALGGGNGDCISICEEELSDWRTSTQVDNQKNKNKASSNNQTTGICHPYYYCA